MKRRVIQDGGISLRTAIVDSPRRPSGPRTLLLIAQTVVVLLAVTPSVIAQDQGSASPGAATASPAEVDVLRKLLGVPAPAPPPPPPPPPPPVQPEPVPVVAPAPEAAPPLPEPEQAVVKPETPTAPSKATVPKPKPAKNPAKPAPVKKPAKPARQPARAPQPVEVREPAPAAVPATEAIAAPAPSPTPVEDVPPAGTVVSSKNMERWKHLLGPSIQWSIARGATIKVIDRKPVPMEYFRAEATERYSAQVRLADDKRSLLNYVAGIPFPAVKDDDPDAAVKMMFNMENKVAWDDLDIRNFSCDTGSLDTRAGFQVQRHYLTEHFRRMFYVSRAFYDPKPLWKTQEGVRYREMLYPLLEPFDLKGSGFSYIRHLDPGRQDDSWLYFPQTRRLRRLSTAQRSEGVFGQDIDLDSYGGFSGNPAWMTWTLLGKKTILASMHADKDIPAKMEPVPANFFPDAEWEPREVYIILGVSQMGGYNFGRRIIYLDAESWIIPYTEIYDLKGGLWRSLIHTWNMSTKAKPDAVRSVYNYAASFIPAMTMVDMQLEHATFCQLPAPEMPNEEGWYYNFGPDEGVTEQVFSVSNMIDTAR